MSYEIYFIIIINNEQWTAHQTPIQLRPLLYADGFDNLSIQNLHI